MRYIKITTSDVANGLGVRVTLWTAGCKHNCPGCHNPETHSFSAGKEFTEETKQVLFKELSKPYIAGLTLSGGDPVEYSTELTELLKEVKEKFPDKNVWLYTGYTLMELYEDPVKYEFIHYIDALVEGRFIQAERNVSLAFRGSNNQRIFKRVKNTDKLTWKDITDELDKPGC